jgi:DNA-directed RNA polymerase subunit M/transcription elongation factor TFIIS
LTTAKKKFVCPECNEKFDAAQKMGYHRYHKHQVQGSAPSSLWARQQRTQDQSLIACPDCDYRAKSKAGLTIHRKAEHGTVSNSATATAIRASNPLQCPQCEFVALTKIGLANHRTRTHGTTSKHQLRLQKVAERKAAKKGLPIEPSQTVTAVAVTNNGHHPEESHFATNGIPEGTLALALGRFQELCRSIATEHDLPPRSFASQLARLIYATTLR